jgi:RNA 2',3'-cyclic 3'-phosphodiesterase
LKRLFFALWPDDQTRQRCIDLQHILPIDNPVASNNLHVTLVFLGQINQETKQLLVKQAENITVPDMTIVFDQLAFWKKPQVLCLTGYSPDNCLNALVQVLTEQVKELSISVDERPYQAHVTLARKVKETVKMDFEPIFWHSRAFCLVQSCSLPTGVEYRVLHTWGEL